MKTKLLLYSSLILACLIQALPLTANAQGSIYLSHLGSAADIGLGIDSNHMAAVSFETGAAAGGYSLDSIQLRMGAPAGSPVGFELLLYNNNGGLPGSSLAPLSGADPSGAGIFTFTASGITLAPSTVYWAVTTALNPGSVGGNQFYWDINPNSATSPDGWSLGSDAFTAYGAAWYGSATTSPFTLAISATAVPEPGTCALTGLGLLAILLGRRK